MDTNELLSIIEYERSEEFDLMFDNITEKSAKILLSVA